VDPTSFITSLGLDFTTQQDAQEFSKLFVGNMLEEPLSHQPDETVSSMVQNQFRGLYEYMTRYENTIGYRVFFLYLTTFFTGAPDARKKHQALPHFTSWT